MQDICIIIPCFNESKRLPKADFELFIQNNDVCFCFVDDGSNDDTLTILEKLGDKFQNKVRVLRNPSNTGKAGAVRNGVLHSLNWKHFEYIGYFDADLATPLSEIEHFMDFFSQSDKLAFALGSRIKRLGVKIERLPLRHYFGRIFATFASLVLTLPVYDTQCGAKIIKSKLAREIFEKPFLSKWLFDIELIARASAIRPVEIFIEVPLKQWIEKGETKIKLIDIFKFPVDLLRINSYYKK